LERSRCGGVVGVRGEVLGVRVIQVEGLPFCRGKSWWSV
jgi:hypothetical protein